MERQFAGDGARLCGKVLAGLDHVKIRDAQAGPIQCHPYPIRSTRSHLPLGNCLRCKLHLLAQSISPDPRSRLEILLRQQYLGVTSCADDILLAAIAAAFDIVPGYKRRRSPHGSSAFFVSEATANEVLHLDRNRFADEICSQTLRGNTCHFFW
jgi:hypothetical protein